MSTNCYLHSLCSHVPTNILTNEDLSKIVDTNDKWIVERTGIKERHKLPDNEETSDLGYYAAKKALDNANIHANELTHIIVATCTPDQISPSVACILAGKLDAGPVMAFDFSAACSGFIYGLNICQGIIATNNSAKILLVCTEAMTRRLNWEDRSTCILFGDAACACILSANEKDSLAKVEDVICQCDGKQNDLIVVGGGTSCRYKVGSQIDERFFLSMQGRETYKHAVRQMTNSCKTILNKNNLLIENIDLFIPHQANLRIIEAVGSRLKIDEKYVFTNVAKYGNTSAASIPLALEEALKENRIPNNGRILITAFGAGLTWGSGLLHF